LFLGGTANPGCPLAAAISPPFSLYKKLLLANDVVWVILSIDPVAPAALAGVFAFWRLLSQPKSFVRNTYESAAGCTILVQTSSLESILAKVYQNKRLQLPLE
jgi:hypothetical protein